MRTLLAGEFDTATNTDLRADVDVIVEVENGSGTFKDLTALLSNRWVAKVEYGEHVNNKVATATITLLPQIGTAKMAPLIETSAINVLDDNVTYSPLIDVGRLVRFSTATVAHNVAPVGGDFRAGFAGRIDRYRLNDAGGVWTGPIVLECSDLGAWLMDLQVEAPGTQYGSEAGVALETVLQSVIDDNLPSGDPAVTVVKQSSSTFNVTNWKQGDGKVFEALHTLVLDSVGEDIRYRFNSSHVSTLQWFDPDRGRSTIDGTFPKESYILRTLDASIDDVRNKGAMPYTDVDAGVSGDVTAQSLSSIDKYRTRFFRLPANDLTPTQAEAQAVLNNVVNDLEAPLAEAEAVVPFCWFVQLFDRYTFEANGRQYTDDQTFSVVGYRHTIENGHATTTLQLAGRVVGAYAEWLKRIKKGGTVQQSISINRISETTAADFTTRGFTMTIGARVAAVHVWYRTVPIDVEGDPYDFSGNETVTEEPTFQILNRVAGSEEITFNVPLPAYGYKITGRMIPFTSDAVEGDSWPFRVDATELGFSYTTAVTENSSAGTGTLTLVVADPSGSIDPTTRIQFYKTINTSRTLVAATTAPAAGVTTGTYTLTLDLDPKHNVKVEPLLTYGNADTLTLGAFTFDSDRRANVVNLSPAPFNGTATVTAMFDTDTAVGTAKARYRVDGGAWTDVDVDADYIGVFTVAMSLTTHKTVEVQGKDADGNYGPSSFVEIPVYVPATSQGTVTIETNGAWNATADGPANALSFRWSFSTSAFPADATVASSGTLVTGTGRLLAMTGAALTFGQVLYITIVPFDAVSAGGNALPAIHLRGSYQTYTATKTATWGLYAFMPLSGTLTFSGGNARVSAGAYPASAAAGLWLTLPPAVTITEMTTLCKTKLGTTAASSIATRMNAGIGSSTPSVVADNDSVHNLGWQTTTSGAISVPVSDDLVLGITLTAESAVDDVEVAYVALTYTMPDPAQTL